MPVFIFPGQGAQFSGMGIDLYDADDGSTGVRALFDLASGITGSDIRTLLNADAETLKQTDVSQVAITVASLAATRALNARGIQPTACAGFSLGEYPALAVAGVITEADAIRLTFERGRIMQDVCNGISGAGMAAVLGLSPEQVETDCTEPTSTARCRPSCREPPMPSTAARKPSRPQAPAVSSGSRLQDPSIPRSWQPQASNSRPFSRA